MHLWSATEEVLHHLDVRDGPCNAPCLSAAFLPATEPQPQPYQHPQCQLCRGTRRTTRDSALYPVFFKIKQPPYVLPVQADRHNATGECWISEQVTSCSLSQGVKPGSNSLYPSVMKEGLVDWLNSMQGPAQGLEEDIGDSRWPKSCEEVAGQAQKASPIFFETAAFSHQHQHLTSCSGISW